MSLDGAPALLHRQLTALVSLVDTVTDAELVRPTGCEGWRVADLVVHLRFGAEGLLAGLATPAEEEPDRDFATYWTDFPPGRPVDFAAVRRTWAMTAAFGTGEELRSSFRYVATAASRAAQTAPPQGRVAFQAHILEVGDFVATWLVELALHHLDLLVGLPERPGPEPAALALVGETLDCLAGRPRPEPWNDLTYARKGTGREALTPDEVRRLGPLAAAYPVFG
jgi:uncharacterized protein (TIGR03083 family)